MIVIAREQPGQRDEILTVNRLAFGGDSEAEIIEKLTEARLVVASLAALSGPEVVGHILFSELDVVVDGRAVPSAALAPLAVMPAFQNRGIGVALVEAGLTAMREARRQAVIVLGHPQYYRRFGFTAESISHLDSPFSGNEAFMGLELEPGALSGASGECRYPAVFGITA